ncbi:MAG: DUF721 domain-containing protein [Bacteroidetes bacterium]|nr:DUF721 domain-containing protein [Bacteroidota bacterium]
MSEGHIGDAIRSFLKTSSLKNGIRAVQIETIWEQMMGKTIAKYTEKISIINHTLFIHTNMGPLKQELVFQKEKIMVRINEAFQEQVIHDVVIK